MDKFGTIIVAIMIAVASTGCYALDSGIHSSVDGSAPKTDQLPAVPSCTDGIKNGSETDIDCGGNDCTGCADGKACKGYADCATGTCSGGICVAVCTTCGTADLGIGSDLAAKPADLAGRDLVSPADMVKPADLASRPDLVPSPDLIPSPASCTDGVKNGTETDIDCGGTCATKCAEGKVCKADADCASTLCVNGVCTPCVDADGDGYKNCGKVGDKDCDDEFDASRPIDPVTLCRGASGVFALINYGISTYPACPVGTSTVRLSDGSMFNNAGMADPSVNGDNFDNNCSGGKPDTGPELVTIGGITQHPNGCFWGAGQGSSATIYGCNFFKKY